VSLFWVYKTLDPLLWAEPIYKQGKWNNWWKNQMRKLIRKERYLKVTNKTSGGKIKLTLLGLPSKRRQEAPPQQPQIINKHGVTFQNAIFRQQCRETQITNRYLAPRHLLASFIIQCSKQDKFPYLTVSQLFMCNQHHITSEMPRCV
jgi:hypothetical protein